MSSKDYYEKLKGYVVKGMTAGDIQELWDITWNEEASARPDAVAEDPAEFANQVERVLQGKLRRKAGSSLPDGVFCIFGVKAVFDYVAFMRMKCKNEYSKDPEKAKEEGYVRVEADRFGEQKTVELDYREKFGTGKVNSNHGEPLDNISGWSFNVFGTWQPTGKTRRFVYLNIGGEGNPEMADPTCPKCGEVNLYTKTCPKCGEVNDDYLFPDFWDRRYKPFKTKIYVRVDDKTKTEACYWQSPDSEFGEYVKIENDEKSKPTKAKFFNLVKYARETPGYEVPSEKDKTKKRLVGAYTAYYFTSKTMLKWWEVHKSGKEKRNETTIPGIAIVSLTRRYAKANKKAEHNIDFDDSERAFSNTKGEVSRSMRAHVQEHVWKNDIQNKIAEDSVIMLVGILDRWQQYDFKAKKQIVGKWQDPHVIAMGCVGVPGLVREPKKVEAVKPETPATETQERPATTKKPRPKKAKPKQVKEVEEEKSVEDLAESVGEELIEEGTIEEKNVEEEQAGIAEEERAESRSESPEKDWV